MKRIGGNATAELQVKTAAKNAIGEPVTKWEPVHTLRGFLDLMGGDSRYLAYSAKLQESTHVFVCDWVELDPRATSESCRLVVGKNAYEVTLIDDPMGLGYQLEFYLRLVGLQ